LVDSGLWPEPAVDPLVSVVVASRDSRPYLSGLCEALRHLDEPPGGYEVIIVDDGSIDGSQRYLQDIAEADHRFHMIRGAGRGPAAARNLGIRKARGRFVAFTDADTVPERGWLVAGCGALRKRGVRVLEGAVIPWSVERPRELVRRVTNEDGGRFMTANMLYERSLLLEVGGFDETFTRPHFLEDSDLAFRVLDRGEPIPFVPEVRVRHRDVPFGPRQALREPAKLQWIALLARKHPTRYSHDLRSKLQTMRPGDGDYLVALLLLLVSRRASVAVRALVVASFGIALRRVLSVSEFRRTRRHRLGWLAVAMGSPALRLLCLAAGWIRFRKIAL
jgi:glycosyltransferase involved in cell wall biosynthesis